MPLVATMILAQNEKSKKAQSSKLKAKKNGQQLAKSEARNPKQITNSKS
jgi:hypothetical protein